MNADNVDIIPLKDLNNEDALAFLRSINSSPDLSFVSKELEIDGELLSIIETEGDCNLIGITKSLPLAWKQFWSRLNRYKEGGVPKTVVERGRQDLRQQTQLSLVDISVGDRAIKFVSTSTHCELIVHFHEQVTTKKEAKEISTAERSPIDCIPIPSKSLLGGKLKRKEDTDDEVVAVLPSTSTSIPIESIPVQGDNNAVERGLQKRQNEILHSDINANHNCSESSPPCPPNKKKKMVVCEDEESDAVAKNQKEKITYNKPVQTLLVHQTSLKTIHPTTTTLAAGMMVAQSRFRATNTTIRTAVKAYCTDKKVAIATYGEISTWDTQDVTDMKELFSSVHFNESIDSWDVSKVINMSSMFFCAEAFNQPLGSWDVSNVIYMSSMFYGARTFNQPLGTWDVSNVIDMSFMFSGATAFNQPLESWNVSNVTEMRSMFSNVTAFNQPLGSWDVSNVTNMSCMFYNAKAFNQPLNSWDVSNVIDMCSMFYGARTFNQPLGTWDVSSVTDMSWMFYGAEAFNQPLMECI